MSEPPIVYKIAGGDVVLWCVDGTIHLKTVNTYNDPVELTDDDALELSTLLARLAKEA